MVTEANPTGNSIKRVGAVAGKNSARQREARQIALLNWLLAFQHDRLTPLRPNVPDRITTKKGRSIVVPTALRAVLREQPFDQARDQLATLHGAHAGGVLAAGAAGRISRRGVQRFHAWWRDVCQQVLGGSVDGAPADRVTDIRLPPVTRMLRVYWRAELVDLAIWPHTLKLQAVALLLKFRDRIRVCPASIDRGQAQCGRPFVRVRRQEHCSVACAQRERSRKWYRDNRKKT